MGHPAQTSLSERLRGVEAEIAAGRAEAALPLCQELATQYPRALAVQRVLGEIYLAMRRPREALAALDRAITGDPEDARACCARAVIHQMHGDQKAALAWYRRACDIRPDDATLRATYREMAASLGQPPYQPSRAGLARLYLRGDLFTHAIREWESLIAENNDFTRLEAHVGLVETLWRAGRPHAAEEWARRTLTNAPSCLKPLLIAGIIAHDDENDAAAEPFLTRAAGLDPEHRTARLLFADRLNTGDTVLATLLWGANLPFDLSSSQATGGSGGAPTSQPISQAMGAQQTGERRVNRPLASGGALQAGAPTTRTNLSAGPAAPLPPPTPPATDLPQNFRRMFKETEGMLWSAAESDPDALRPAAIPPTPPQPAPQPYTAPASSAPSPLSSGVMGFDAATPPAIAESGFALGDTEMRRAIRWVQWLQAQGARALGDEPQRARPSGSLDALFNNPASGPLTGGPGASNMIQSAPLLPPSAAPSPPVTRLTTTPALPSDTAPGATTAPPREPSSADLRQMFTELNPDPDARGESRSRPLDNAVADTSNGVGSPSIVSSTFYFEDPSMPPPAARDLTPAVTPAPAASEPASSTFDPLAFDAAPVSAPSAFAGFADHQPLPPPVAPAPSPAPTPARSVEPDPAPFAAFANLAPPVPMPPAANAPRESALLPWPEESAAPVARTPTSGPSFLSTLPDATIEQLAQQESAEGFIALEPGALSAIAGKPSATSAHTDEWLDTSGGEEPLAPAPPVEPEPTPTLASEETPPAPDPHDYAARLEQARGHRDSGALDEAIIEYRTVVRNAPDLLPDVLTDVQGLLEASPEHPELHRLHGDALIRQGDYMAALESYNRATELSQALDGQ